MAQCVPRLSTTTIQSSGDNADKNMPNRKKDPSEVKENAGVAWKRSTILKLASVAMLHPGKTKSELSEEIILEWCDRQLQAEDFEQQLERLGLLE